MGQIVGGAAKPKRCNLNKLSQLGTPAAGEHILVSSDNSMNAAGQGNFDCYIEGDGQTAASELKVHFLQEEPFALNGNYSRTYRIRKKQTNEEYLIPIKFKAGNTYTFNIAQTVTSRAVYVWVCTDSGKQGSLTTALSMSSKTSSSWVFTPSTDYDYLYIVLYCNGYAIEGLAFSITSTSLNGLPAEVEELSKEVKTGVSPDTRWPHIFTKDDAFFKGRINSGTGELSDTGTVYNYVFKVWDVVHFNAMFPEGYIVNTAIHSTYEGALKNTSATGSYFGRGAATAQNTYTQYRFGDSSVKKGYLMVRVAKSDSSVVTDSDIEMLESSYFFDFYPNQVQGQIKELNDEVSKLKGDVFLKNDFALFVSNSAGWTATDSTNTERIRFFKQNFNAGWKVTVDITNVLTNVSTAVYACATFDTIEHAEQNASAGILETVISGWTNENKSGITTKDGILSIYFKKSDNTSFTYEEVLAIKENISITAEKVSAGDVDVEEDGDYDEIPLENFKASSDTVLTNDICCVPYQGATYTFVLPDGIKARVNEGTSTSLTSGTYVTGNGTITLGANTMTQQFQFAKVSGGSLSVSEMNTFVNNGAIKVIYKRRDLPVEKRNYDNEKFVKAALYRMGWASSEEIYELAGLESMPIITHTSDLHGDFKRFENFMEYSKIINADIAVSTGDNVLYVSGNGSLYLKDVISKHTGVPFASCIGNHEVYPQNTVSNTDLFNNFISPYVAQGNYLASANNAATMPYYYVDIAAKNIRVIVINQYDNGCYYGSGLGGRLGQAQVTWLCNTLLSTPAGYGVVIAMHSNEAKVNTPEAMSAWNQTVNWDGGNEDTAGYAASGLYVNEIRPIRTIVDAFISKTSLSTSYDENTVNGNNGETVTINADFSNVNEGVEFICYLTGHRHKDNIGYVDGATNKQLMLNIVCGNCHYPRGGGLSFSEGCDIPRGDRGATQDAFNVYTIDRRSGNVRIARIGSDFNFQGIERKFLVAPYKD